MKYLLLIPFFTLAQSKAPSPRAAFITKYNSEVHFYGSCLINDVAYSAQTLIWPNRKPAKKLLISNAVTLSLITLKEVYDIRKPKPTGWSWDDWLIGVWAMAIYCIVRICINDFRKPKEKPILEP